MTLLRDDATSLYEQIATTLRDEIEQGAYEPTGKLPSEAQLSERFQVSRVTVRLALDRLTDARVVERKQGRARSPPSSGCGIDWMCCVDCTIRSRDRGQGTDGTAAHGGVRRAARPATRVRRRRHALRLSRTPALGRRRAHRARADLLPEASDVAFARADSLPTYELLEQLLGWRIADADMSVTAVAAPDDIAVLLKTAKQAPLLVLRRTSRLADGRTCESTVFHIRPERFDLVRSGVEARFVG